eukprot:4913785-Amphidinium_carterae.1
MLDTPALCTLIEDCIHHVQARTTEQTICTLWRECIESCRQVTFKHLQADAHTSTSSVPAATHGANEHKLN